MEERAKPLLLDSPDLSPLLLMILYALYEYLTERIISNKIVTKNIQAVAKDRTKIQAAYYACVAENHQWNHQNLWYHCSCVHRRKS